MRRRVYVDTTKNDEGTVQGFKRVKILLESLGIDSESFLSFVEWALSEQLVETMSRMRDIQDEDYFIASDSLKRFRDLLRERTRREWSINDLNLLFDAAKNKQAAHFREPLTYGEYLKLLWTAPHRCVKCGKEPPEVTLHVDHITPASLGGKSKRHNIQFLCEKCNLKKSNKLEGGEPWLELL
jgi:5-methylcytosine-specific restriction endonuclease McrA